MSVSAKDSIGSNVVIEKTDKTLAVEEEDIGNLPEVQRRIRALMKLQFNKVEVDGELEKEIWKLIDQEFGQKYRAIYAKRRDIISGNVEPTDEECDFELGSQTAEPVIEAKDQSIAGIPRFWLEAMLNITEIREWITDEDESALTHLKDIVISYESNPAKLVLEFHFEPNEYFENEVLRKEYLIEFGPSKDFPSDSSNYHTIGRKGSQINWKNGKNLLKDYSTPENSDHFDSFFSFFNPPEEPKDTNELKEALEDHLWQDWQLGLTIAEKLVPSVVLYYTGDAIDEETESESSDSETESESESSTD